MQTRPASGCSSPAITRSRVDFPDPLGPSNAVSPPSGTLIETSSSATKFPKRLVTSLTVMAISGLLFDGLWDEHAGSREVPAVTLLGVGAARRPLLKEVHAEQDQQGEDREHQPGRIGAGDVEVVELVLYEDRQGLGLPVSVTGDDGHGAELAERPRRREHDAVREPPPDRWEGDPPERLHRRGAQSLGGLLLVGADLLKNRHHLAHDERQRDEDRRQDHPGNREDHLDPILGERLAEPAVARRVDQEERQPDHDRRDREGQIDGSVEESPAPELLPDEDERG